MVYAADLKSPFSPWKTAASAVHVATMSQPLGRAMATIRKRTWKAGDLTKTAWVADYFDQHGKRRLKTFKQKKEADAWLVAARREVQQGLHSPASNSISVAQAGDIWIAEAEADGLERGTVRQYRQHLDYHINPLMGAVKLAELSVANVKEFRGRMILEGRSRIMAKKVVSSLGAILATAMENGKITQNVVRVQTPRRRREAGLDQRHKKRIEVGVDIPSKEEIRAMLADVQGWARPLIVAAIFTGLRASELRGLRWIDVDLAAGELTVRQRADRWGTLGSPKSDAGKRSVPLAPMVANTLKEWRFACPKSEADLVFPTTQGKPRQINTIHTQALAPLQRALGLCEGSTPKYGMHSLRHAAASLFIEQGFSPKRVQALMGHSTIQMTFDTYGHLFPAADDDRIAMSKLQARLIG
jgi:integrase